MWSVSVEPLGPILAESLNLPKIKCKKEINSENSTMSQNPLYWIIDSLVLLVDPDHSAPWTSTPESSCIGSLHLLRCEIAACRGGNIERLYSAPNDLLESILAYRGV